MSASDDIAEMVPMTPPTVIQSGLRSGIRYYTAPICLETTDAKTTAVVWRNNETETHAVLWLESGGAVLWKNFFAELTASDLRALAAALISAAHDIDATARIS